MSRDILHRWLQLESTYRDEEAEIALLELFGSLATPAPSPQLADRVLRQAGIVRPEDLQGWSRYLTIAALLMTGSATAWLAPLLLGFLFALDLGAAISLSAEALAATAQILADLWAFGSAFGSFGRALWLAAGSPQALIAFSLTTTFVLIVGRCLIALISSQRSHTHVPI